MFEQNEYVNGDAAGESALCNFASTIDVAGTSKAVFVSTVSFPHAAGKNAHRSPKRDMLIGRQVLARLTVKHPMVVRKWDPYEIKRIDESYFSQEAQ